MRIQEYKRSFLTLGIISFMLALMPISQAHAAMFSCFTHCSKRECENDPARAKLCDSRCPKDADPVCKLKAQQVQADTIADPKFITTLHNLFFAALREENKNPNNPGVGKLKITPNTPVTTIVENIRQEISRILVAWDAQYHNRTFGSQRPPHINDLFSKCAANPGNCGIYQNEGLAKKLYCPASILNQASGGGVSCNKAFSSNNNFGGEQMKIVLDQDASNLLRVPYQGGLSGIQGNQIGSTQGGYDNDYISDSSYGGGYGGYDNYSTIR